MGWNTEQARTVAHLMKPEDQQRYASQEYLEAKRRVEASTAPDPKLDPHPPVKSGGSEKKEQNSFANYLIERNERGAKIPWVWHAMHKASRATPGTPDFWVGINGHGIFFEFKRDYSCELTPPQETFRLYCEAQGIEHHVVYSAFEAIKWVEQADSLW
jgi:hypothetical protein